MGDSGAGRVLGLEARQSRDMAEARVHTRHPDSGELVHHISVGTDGVLLVQTYAIEGDGLREVSEVTLDLAPRQPRVRPRLAGVLSLADRLPLPEAA